MTHALINELNAFQKQFQEKAKAAIKAEFRSFFEKHPEVSAICWTQYTPYFNDGDTCEFSVHEPVFCEGDERPDYEGEDGDILSRISKETEGYTDYSRSGYPKVPPARSKTPEEAALEEDAATLTSLVTGMDDAMKATFGDHVKVTATRGGFDVDEYEHD